MGRRRGYSTHSVSRDTPAAVVFAALAALVIAFGVAPAASAARPCGDLVMRDWSDDGRIDRLYPLHCYEDAIDDLPPDLRDYTDAADVIERALYTAVRKGTASIAPQPEGSSSSARALLLVALAGGSVVLAAAAVIGVLVRRGDPGEGGTHR